MESSSTGLGTTTMPTTTTADGGSIDSGSTFATSMVEGTSSESSSSTGEPPAACLGGGGVAEVGESCTANTDCASGVCTIYTDVPVNEDAVCAASAEDCSTRVTGTVFDFSSREPLPGANVIVAAALQAATNPTGAMAIIEATAGDDGRIDATSAGPIMAPIGIVALTSLGGYYLTATGVATPVDGSSYNMANSIHDLWAVTEGDLQNWTDELDLDFAIPAENLPLGDAGGVVGFVRDAAGLPVAGAALISTDDASGAFIRYLEDDGSFSLDRTSDTGIFVILEPALAEYFEVTVDGAVAGGGTAGSAPGAIFTMVITVG